MVGVNLKSVFPVQIKLRSGEIGVTSFDLGGEVKIKKEEDKFIITSVII